MPLPSQYVRHLPLVGDLLTNRAERIAELGYERAKLLQQADQLLVVIFERESELGEAIRGYYTEAEIAAAGNAIQPPAPRRRRA